jgi:hypothetical protein
MQARMQNIEAQLAKAPHGDWQRYIYTLVQHAPHFQLSKERGVLRYSVIIF